MEHNLEASIKEFAAFAEGNEAFSAHKIQILESFASQSMEMLERVYGKAVPESIANHYQRHGRIIIQWTCQQAYRIFQSDAKLAGSTDLWAYQKRPQVKLLAELKLLHENGYLILDDLNNSSGFILMHKSASATDPFLFLSAGGISYPLTIRSFEEYVRLTIGYMGLCGWQLLHCPALAEYIGTLLGEDMRFIEELGFSFSNEAFHLPNSVPTSILSYSDANKKSGLPNRFLEIFQVQNPRFQFVKIEIHKGANPLHLLPLAERGNWTLPPELIGFYLQISSAAVISKREGEIWSSFRIPQLFEVNKGTNAFFQFQDDPVAALEGTYPFLIDEAGHILMRPTPEGLQFELAIDFDNIRPLKSDFHAMLKALLDAEGRSGWQRDLR